MGILDPNRLDPIGGALWLRGKNPQLDAPTPAGNGRFDLAGPSGTCYLAGALAAVPFDGIRYASRYTTGPNAWALFGPAGADRSLPMHEGWIVGVTACESASHTAKCRFGRRSAPRNVGVEPSV